MANQKGGESIEPELHNAVRLGNPKSTPLEIALNTDVGERLIHRELEKLPWVLVDLFSGGIPFVVSHFSLGDEFEADFVVLKGFSGGWNIHFIELEPASLQPFKANGEFSPRLNHAAAQIRKWRAFYERRDKLPYLVSQLNDAVIKKDLLWADHREPTDSVGWPFIHPDSWHVPHFHVIMGRRQQFATLTLRLKAGLAQTEGFELITYDRVLDLHLHQLEDPAYQ